MENVNEAGLWRAVIMTAFDDLSSKSKSESATKARLDAFNWVFSPENEKDFAEVCALAGVDADGIRREIRKQTDTKVAA
jgi:hypothetical protein